MAHARVSFYQASDPDRAARAFEGAVSPVQEMQGNRGGLFLIDRNNNKAITITLWEDEDSLKASAEQANQVRQSAADSGGLDIQGVESYEIAVEFGR
jgi:heme-degrading monooxygenase HmoA